MIVFVTGNKNKLAEVQAILGVERIESRTLDLPELQGDPEEITRQKCSTAARIVNGPVIIEDTSLCFNALGGMPGPYIKWFLDSIGLDGLVRMLHGFSDKTAYAQCIFAYSEGPESEPIVFKGILPGTIVEPRGPTRFGWDPIFQPDGCLETFAEMNPEVKNAISHRRISLDLLAEHLD